MRSLKIFSSGIKKIPYLAAFLPEFALHRQPAEAVAGWGLRPTANKAREYAQSHHLPFIALEDGFLRSLGLGVNGWPPLSMVVDDLGIYYDTSRPSRLETMILSASVLPENILADANHAMQLIVQHGLSKYNHAPDLLQSLRQNREVVLLIDQTFGDMAVKYGGANESDFKRMLQTALTEHPQADIWIKTHPDVLSGKKKGYFSPNQQHERVHFFAEDVSPLSLLKEADIVYCVTSHMGFEALLLGKKVITFGLPWYAGWGLTDDRHQQSASLSNSARRDQRTLTQLFAAAYLQYSRYINPNNGETGSIFDVINYLIKARQWNERLRGDLYCIGLSLWKRAVMKPFFNVPACRLHFIRSIKSLPKNLPQNARLLAWGNGKDMQLKIAKARNISVLRMEDGFIRSVGLGSNLVAPLSLVIDDLGIYFNPQTPSRLEHILCHHTFTQDDQQQAEALQAQLLTAGINKYNVGGMPLELPTHTKTTILVPGQVEDDASIRTGAPQICTNLGLLRAVREANPDGFIVYKPHPDVVSGNRKGKIDDDDALQYADLIAEEYDINTCLENADEVHTMTSLTGFEALLRGKKVICYGLPFYAGWGLTQDMLPITRRNRQLKLWQLIAGTLLYYPAYIHPNTHQMIDATTAARLLAQQKQALHHTNKIKRNWFAKQANKLQHLFRSLK